MRFTLSTAVIAAVIPCHAQAPQPSAPTPPGRLQFEVASIKPAPPLSPALIQSGRAAGTKVNPARVEIWGAPLNSLIAQALRVKLYQMEGPDRTRRTSIRLPGSGTTRPLESAPGQEGFSSSGACSSCGFIHLSRLPDNVAVRTVATIIIGACFMASALAAAVGGIKGVTAFRGNRQPAAITATAAVKRRNWIEQLRSIADLLTPLDSQNCQGFSPLHPLVQFPAFTKVSSPPRRLCCLI